VAMEAVVVARSAEGLQLGLLQAGAEAMAAGDAVEPVSTATYTHKCYSTFCKKFFEKALKIRPFFNLLVVQNIKILWSNRKELKNTSS